jgi:signal transduction histidine kinase
MLQSLRNFMSADRLPEPSAIDAVPLFVDLVEAARPVTPAVILEHPDHLVVRADAQHLRTLLQELISNALRHAMDRAEARLELGARPGCNFFLRDNGCGIDSARQACVFMPFSGRGAEAPDFITPPHCGLGLATVARIAAVHGGRAWLQSEAGWGSTFSVLLAPLQMDDGSTSDAYTPAKFPR